MTTFCQKRENHERRLLGAWWIVLALCLAPAFADPPHLTPAVFDSTHLIRPADGYSLDSRVEESVAEINPLIGFWEYRSDHGTITLLVKSNRSIVISGHEMSYELRPGILHVVGDEGAFDYPYELVSDRLILTTVDGESAARDISFRRVGLTGLGEVYSPEIRVTN